MSVFALCPIVFYKNILVYSNMSYFSKAYFLYFYKLYVSVSTTKYDLKTSGGILTYFDKIQNTPSYSYLQIGLNTLIYVVIVFIRRYAHICFTNVFWSQKYSPPPLTCVTSLMNFPNRKLLCIKLIKCQPEI